VQEDLATCQITSWEASELLLYCRYIPPATSVLVKIGAHAADSDFAMCVQMMPVDHQCFFLFTAQLAATTKRASGTRQKQQKHKQLQQQLKNAERVLTSLVVGRRCCVSNGMMSTCPCSAARLFTRSPGYRDSVESRISGDSIFDTCIHVMLRFARLRPCSLCQMRFDEQLRITQNLLQRNQHDLVRCHAALKQYLIRVGLDHHVDAFNKPR
jgi:hypothetical protein